MGLQAFQIFFDNPSATYKAGETVSGHIKLTVTSPKSVRGISVVISGSANTYWAENVMQSNHEGKRESVLTAFKGTEVYFQNKFYVLGSQNGQAQDIPTGSYTYPFSTTLPTTLPTSFEGEYGNIRYTVKATIDRPWKFDHHAKGAFTVLSNVDLNSQPELLEEQTRELTKKFWCWCCATGPLNLTVSVPQTGFAPGQFINVIVDVENHSSVVLNGVELALMQVATFTSQTPSRETKKQSIHITGTHFGQLMANDSKIWRYSIEVPSLPPSDALHCSIIQLQYELQVIGRSAGIHKNVNVKIPISIGTSPLWKQPVEATAPDYSFDATKTQGDSTDIGWITPLRPETPPPTYMESVFGTKSIQDSDDSDHTLFSNDSGSFFPRYPVYRMSSSE